MAYVPSDDIRNMRNQYFQSRRDEATQGANAMAQQGEDAIQRRFASMGASGSGASIAAMQNNRNAAADQLRKGLSDVNSQELQAQEGDAAKDFQSNEAATARQFQSGMADKDMAFKQKLADVDQGNKLKELDMAQQQFNLDKDTTEFNKQLALMEAQQAGKNTGMFGNMMNTIKGDAGNIAGAGVVLGPMGASLQAGADLLKSGGK